MSEMSTAPRLRLYLIRRGETEPAAAGKLIGQTDVTLSERGVEQARRLAEKLTTVRLEAVYSSDLRRACHTAEIIAEHNLASAHYEVVPADGATILYDAATGATIKWYLTR
jgi:broad specificity phosphatase PhoE